jgi:hypothetical protein
VVEKDDVETVNDTLLGVRDAFETVIEGVLIITRPYVPVVDKLFGIFMMLPPLTGADEVVVFITVTTLLPVTATPPILLYVAKDMPLGVN